MEYIVTDYKKSGGGRIELCLNETIKLWLYVKEARQFSIEEGAGLTEEQYQQLLPVSYTHMTLPTILLV